MNLFLQFTPLLSAMAVLLVGSAFFSASEAALFYLTRDDREQFVHGNRAQKRVLHLLATPERLLTCILFWNLVINIVYFALASRIGLSLEREGQARPAAVFSFAALLAIILLSEMLPKNLAVLWPRAIAAAVSLPLSGAIGLLPPLLPTLQAVNRISLRTILPNFEREAYLELRDIERAISLSTPDKTLAQQEELVLHQIVSLSELEAAELMRPRLGLTFYHTPVTLNDLRQNPPNCAYLLVAEPGSEELDRAMPLSQLARIDAQTLESECERVPYVPWCASGATTLDVLRNSRNGLAVVINELGETIGIVTFDDVMHTLFVNAAVRNTSRAATQAIKPAGEGKYQVDGAIALRRLAKHLQIDLPNVKSVTVAGLLQEYLQRLPQLGDEVEWGGCRFRVVDSPRPGVLTATVERLPDGASSGETFIDGGGL